VGSSVAGVNHHATDEPTIDPFGDKNASHYATDEPTIYRFRDKNANPPGSSVA
jgi:hypothetical protein